MRAMPLSPDQIWRYFTFMDKDLVRFRGWQVGLDKYSLAVTSPVRHLVAPGHLPKTEDSILYARTCVSSGFLRCHPTLEGTPRSHTLKREPKDVVTGR